MNIMDKKKPLSTYDRIMQDPQRKAAFEKEYRKFILVETLIPLLEKCTTPVRILVRLAGVSPTIIQDIKSGKKEGISFSTFLAILEALGYRATLQIDRPTRKSPRELRVRSLRSRKRRKIAH